MYDFLLRTVNFVRFADKDTENIGDGPAEVALAVELFKTICVSIPGVTFKDVNSKDVKEKKPKKLRGKYHEMVDKVPPLEETIKLMTTLEWDPKVVIGEKWWGPDNAPPAPAAAAAAAPAAPAHAHAPAPAPAPSFPPLVEFFEQPKRGRVQGGRVRGRGGRGRGGASSAPLTGMVVANATAAEDVGVALHTLPVDRRTDKGGVGGKKKAPKKEERELEHDPRRHADRSQRSEKRKNVASAPPTKEKKKKKNAVK